MATKIIENTESRIHTISTGYEMDDDRAMVPATISLLPGFNFVDEAEWAKAKTQISTQRLLTGEKLLERKSTVPSRDHALKKMQTREASATVAKTFDLNTLRAWAVVEGRPAIAALIDKQIDDVMKAGARQDPDGIDDTAGTAGRAARAAKKRRADG